MKHRSVIAFVIVAAALFAAPQLSHDLQTLRGAIASRLHGELLQAFLNLHTDDVVPAASAASPRRAHMLFASCTQEKAGAPASKAKKAEPRAAAEPRAEAPDAESPRIELAMMGEPAEAEAWAAEAARAGAAVVVKAPLSRPGVGVENEVAMIIPPDSGIEPSRLAGLRAAESKAREGASQKRKAVEGLRHVAYVSARFDADAEWRKAGEEVLRELNGTLPGAFEFRTNREGVKTKTLKVIKRNDALRAIPRAPRAPGQVACTLPLPAPAAPQVLPAAE